MIPLDDESAARHEGAKPEDDRPVTERFLTVREVAEKLGIPIEAARALVTASLSSSRITG
jgi:hypothetical protein